MISLVFDTETTGAVSKPDFRDPSIAGIVQLFGALFEHDPQDTIDVQDIMIGDMKGERFIVKPKPFAVISTIVDVGRAIEPGAQKVHGIDRDKTKRLGVDPKNLAHIFEDFIDIADVLVAHNKKFDLGIVGRLLHENDLDATILTEKETFCTMNAMKPVMRLTPKVYGDWKNPKLIEAYRYIFNEDFKGEAHDAAADSLACADIYFACRYMELKDPTA